VDIVENGDGTVTIRYQPTETGLHNLHVSYNDEPLEGSPYQFYVSIVVQCRALQMRTNHFLKLGIKMNESSTFFGHSIMGFQL